MFSWTLHTKTRKDWRRRRGLLVIGPGSTMRVPFGTYAWIRNLEVGYTGGFLNDRKTWNYDWRVGLWKNLNNDG